MKASTIFICLELVFLMFAVEDAFLRRRRRRYCPPIACEVSEWSTWSNCSLPCGTNGQKTRTRTVTKPAACGGACPSVLSETQICNAEESHCHDQGTPRDDYCACKGGYTGNCCEMKCGGNFDGKEGTFHYEGFPGTKVGDCTWTAHTPQQSTVTAKIDSCSLLVSGETSGYIEIRDGDVTDFNEAHILRNVTQSDCEEGLVHVEYTTSNKMWIRLHAPEILQEKVYFHFKFQACGGKIELLHGSITSPFYPESYVKDGACNWTVQTPHATVISANFANFTLRSSDDFVLIGNTEGAGDIGRYSNNDTYRYIADTTKNRLWLSLQAFEFEERDLAERLGFRFEFQAKFVATADIISGYNGSTFSPLYPLSYPTNVTFTTTISTPTRTGTIVRLEFTELNIRRGDNVSVYDDAGNLIAAYDHDNDVAVVMINSSMSSVILRSGFSDNPTIGTYRFTFQALTVCFRPTEMNGNVIPEQPFYEPGDVMVITCKEGHELSTNNPELTCQNDGNWNAEVPGCLDVINGDNIIGKSGIKIKKKEFSSEQ
ncbi:cubilin-like [Ptychodera flava]|uniref:cubilin-like n=1 Tax=Ptychodera flava TaxID=63121 RepID=UPI00396A37E9